MIHPSKDQGSQQAKQQYTSAKELTLMYWLGLHRNSNAKSHGSWCWHEEEAFPPVCLLLSTSCRGSKVLGCPWLPASTCTLNPGLEVTDHKRLSKAAPSITDVSFTLNFHSHQISGLAIQCICLLMPLAASPSVWPMLLHVAAILICLLCPACCLLCGCG